MGLLINTTTTLLASDPAAENVAVEIEGAAPPILGDPELLKIVFLNLLVNGAHAMDGRGELRVSLRTDGAFCSIAFIDRGPGIPVEIREKIFTPFFTTKSRGTGLGLPTAKRLIEAHEGTIALHCPAEGGTTIIVSLPVAELPATNTAPGPILEPA